MKVNSVYVGTDAPHGHFELVAEIQVDPTYDRPSTSTQDAPKTAEEPELASATTPRF